MAKILLVDDDQAISTVFTTALIKGGFSAVAAQDGKTAIEKIKSEKPDLVLLDQVLPDLNGNDVLKQLKSNPETKSIPVMMLSNFGQDEFIKDAMQNGAAEYILKYQVSTQDLVDKVKQALNQQNTPDNINDGINMPLN